MKLLQNKSTGEIGCLECLFEKTPEKITVVEYIDGRRGSKVWYYDTLAELNVKWEDYKEEPKEYWYIDWNGEVCRSDIHDERTEQMKLIGNYFETKEEAEKAVEKLKAFKRLEDKGFKFDGIEVFRDGVLVIDGVLPALESANTAERCKIVDDLELLFGEE